MKKIFKNSMVVLAGLTFMIAGCKKATTTNDTTTPEAFYASTDATTRTAVLEDFTGVRCQYCPDGHDRAKVLKDANPKKFIVIATHGGSYATPSGGWMDFTTPVVTGLISQSGLTGYPAGTMNRLPATTMGGTPMTSGGTAMGRGEWAKTATSVNALPAPVNLGGIATWDATAKEVTVRVDMYYTSDETVPTNLNVGLVQDGIISKQSVAGVGTVTTYVQNNVLRSMITGTFGEQVATAATKGTKITKTYKMFVPNVYNVNTVAADGGGASDITKMRVVAYATRGNVNILNGVEIAIKP